MSDAPKSALELAMERLKKQDEAAGIEQKPGQRAGMGDAVEGVSGFHLQRNVAQIVVGGLTHSNSLLAKNSPPG